MCAHNPVMNSRAPKFKPWCKSTLMENEAEISVTRACVACSVFSPLQQHEVVFSEADAAYDLEARFVNTWVTMDCVEI